jgi:hypothetical protein
MANRLDWNASAGLITEPSDKKFEEDDLVAAEHLNWIIEQAERNFDDLEQLTFLDSANTGQIKQLIVGASGLYRGGYDEGGVSFYTAFNAKWTGSDWEEIDDTKAEPALIAYNVTDESQLNGVSSGDFGPNNWIVLYASSVSGSNVITWNTAPQVVNTLLLSDSDGDGNRWGLQEQVDGDLHVEHPDRADDYIFNEDGPTNDEDVADKQYVDQNSGILAATWYNGPELINSIASSGSTLTATFDATNESFISDDAEVVILRGKVKADGGGQPASSIEIKQPSHTNYVEFAYTEVDETGTINFDTTMIPYGLVSGQFNYRMNAESGFAELYAIGEI